jgi:hypothetical protein
MTDSRLPISQCQSLCPKSSEAAPTPAASCIGHHPRSTERHDGGYLSVLVLCRHSVTSIEDIRRWVELEVDRQALVHIFPLGKHGTADHFHTRN